MVTWKLPGHIQEFIFLLMHRIQPACISNIPHSKHYKTKEDFSRRASGIAFFAVLNNQSPKRILRTFAASVRFWRPDMKVDMSQDKITFRTTVGKMLFFMKLEADTFHHFCCFEHRNLTLGYDYWTMFAEGSLWSIRVQEPEFSLTVQSERCKFEFCFRS